MTSESFTEEQLREQKACEDIIDQLAPILTECFLQTAGSSRRDDLPVVQTGFIGGMALGMAVFCELGRRFSKPEKKDSFEAVAMEHMHKAMECYREQAAEIVN